MSIFVLKTRFLKLFCLCQLFAILLHRVHIQSLMDKIYFKLVNRQGLVTFERFICYASVRELLRKIAILLLTELVMRFKKGNTIVVTEAAAEAAHPFDNAEVIARLQRWTKDEKDILLLRLLFIHTGFNEAANKACLNYNTARKRLTNIYQAVFDIYYKSFSDNHRMPSLFDYLLTGSFKHPVTGDSITP
jgi:hypothetical protein